MTTATTARTADQRDVGSQGLSREVVVLGVVFVLGATIMTVLDLTIVNVAVPSIGRELSTSISGITSWAA
jgi:hypothetical protein